jgi:hypothetical protein
MLVSVAVLGELIVLVTTSLLVMTDAGDVGPIPRLEHRPSNPCEVIEDA